MIAALTGIVDSVGKDDAVIDVGGVGYLVFASARTLGSLPAQGASVRLMIETHVREDHIHLYGFADRAERDWFRLLTTVQGVGARVGLALLSVLAPDEIATAIAAQDKAAITRADGVGPKLAARILNELKDKAGSVGGDPVVAAGAGASGAASGPAATAATTDAVSALVNLGYSRSDAFAAVARVAADLGDDADVGQIIPLALKELAT